MAHKGGDACVDRRAASPSGSPGEVLIAVVQSVLADSEAYIVDINGLPGLITLRHGALVSALALDLERGRITDLYLMAAPSKLGAVRRPA